VYEWITVQKLASLPEKGGVRINRVHKLYNVTQVKKFNGNTRVSSGYLFQAQKFTHYTDVHAQTNHPMVKQVWRVDITLDVV